MRSNEKVVTFKSEDLSLEGLLLVQPTPASSATAVVCHPHPQYGGSMYNSVVEAILDGLWELGYSTLRFNFRGVGASQGGFGGGAGETRDATSAVAFVRSCAGAPEHKTLLAGYSFGAVVALRAGRNLAVASPLVAVAPPIGFSDLSFVKDARKAVILIGGDRDTHCPASRLKELYDSVAVPKAIDFIGGADHFFVGCEAELTSALKSAIRQLSP